jgi:ABC-2 type transport system permease protein
MAAASFARSLRPYVWYARLAFQRRAAYRLANFTGIAVNFFFFLIHAQVYFAFFAGRPSVAGWSAPEAVLYFATSESLLMVLGAMPSWGMQLMERICTGEVLSDLARPVTLYPREVAERFGSAAYFFGTRTVILYAAAVWLYDLAPPLRAELLLLPLCLVLAVAVSASLWYLVNAVAFWTEHAMGPVQANVLLMWLFGGVLLPLDFLPDPMRLACDVLPWRATIYTPVALASGRLEGAALAFGLAHQVVWGGLLALACRAVEARGVRRLVVHGG